MSPQLDQIQYKVLEDEVHEVKRKRPREQHRSDQAKDGHTFHPIFLGKLLSFCIGRCMLYLSPHLENFIMLTKRQIRDRTSSQWLLQQRCLHLDVIVGQEECSG